jgi:Flp pilus assembly protein TadD
VIRAAAPLLLAFALGVALVATPALADPTDEEPESARIDPDFASGKKAIEGKDWATALKALSSAALRDTRNADIQNYLGYAYRNAGQMPQAFEHYERALKLNPRHRGAHEYVGEAWLLVGNLLKAEEHVAALRTICLTPCEQLEDLEKKVQEYRAHPRK